MQEYDPVEHNLAYGVRYVLSLIEGLDKASSRPPYDVWETREPLMELIGELQDITSKAK